jgi:curved DNA-binding protein CbpA
MSVERSHYAILGVAETATSEQIISAYRLLVKTKHPDRVAPDLHAAAEAEFREITAAYNTLRSPAGRQEYDRARKAGMTKSDTRINPDQEARQALARGQKKLAANDFFGAYKDFEAAVTHKPGWAEAHFQLGLVCLKNSQWRRRGVDSIEKAIELDGEQPQYHVQLIKVYLEAGLKSRALAVFQQADSKFPGNAELAALAEPLGAGKPADSGGLLGIFRKKV